MIETISSPVTFLLGAAAVSILFVLMRALHRSVSRTSSPSPRPDPKLAVQREAKAIEDKSDTAFYTYLRGAGYLISPFALPVGAASIAAGKAGAAFQNQLNLRTEKMPYSWLSDAEADASEEGKIYLGKNVTTDGLISIHHALKWMELEAGLSAKAHVVAPDSAHRRVVEAYENSRPLAKVKSAAQSLSGKLPFVRDKKKDGA
jgi:hypothetical protein